MKKHEDCWKCYGTGFLDYFESDDDCPECGGTGWLEHEMTKEEIEEEKKIRKMLFES